jgi:hypothetical protein
MARRAPRRWTRATRRAAATMLLAGGIAASHPSIAGADHRPGPCGLRRQRGETVRAHERELIRCATNHWGVFGGYRKALCIAKRESGLDPKAVSADGNYLGLYQHARRYWPARYAEYTKPSWGLNDDALVGRTNAIVSIRMAHADGWSAWHGTGCAVDA